MSPRTPAIGVASGPFVFIYRNLRPYFKFTVPPVEIDPTEAEIWKGLRAESDLEKVAQACEMLTAARDNGTPLSARSLDLLAIEDADSRFAYVEAVKEQPHRQDTVITCMSTMPKNSEEPDAVSSLVIGTESRLLIILDPAATTKLCQVELASVPIFICVTGTFDVDWRVVAACRDGRVYTITIGDHRGVAVIRKPNIELETQPCGLARVDKSIYVATMDSTLHCYTLKGKKAFSLHLDHKITNLESFHVRKQRIVQGVLVALDNGEVRMYREKTLITTLHVHEPIAALRFGQYGREESSLVVLSKNGGLFVKMLQRSANLEASAAAAGPPPEQDIPLNIPKKTRVYVDQTTREKEMAIDMHRVFQARARVARPPPSHPLPHTARDARPLARALALVRDRFPLPALMSRSRTRARRRRRSPALSRSARSATCASCGSRRRARTSSSSPTASSASRRRAAAA